MHSGYKRAEERTTGAERTGNVDCNHIYGPPVELNLRSGQLTQIRAHPGGMERNVALADYPPVCLKAAARPTGPTLSSEAILMTFSLLLTTKS